MVGGRDKSMGMKKLAAVFGPLALALALMPWAYAAAESPAAFTTVNETKDGTGHCGNGAGIVNCNLYDGRQFVWLNGGPSGAALADGTYFFVVLEPGGQHDPNDGADKNLSDDFDAYTNRTFTVADGVLSYSGTHSFDSNMIRLAPYANTDNPGGEYDMAICSLVDGYPVAADVCKHDNFKLTAEGSNTVQAVLSGTKYLDENTDGQLSPGEPGLGNWTISITEGTHTFTETTDSAGNWSFTTALPIGSRTIAYTISEVSQSGYSQTGNTVDQSSATGSVAVTLNLNKTYTVAVPSEGPGSASGLNFGNIPLATELTTAKTATPAFTRAFTWTIAKTVDTKRQNVPAGTAATFNYIVTVSHDSGTDSGWQVSGTIAVQNPNGAGVTGASLSDGIDDAKATCTVTGGGSGLTIPAGTSTFAYDCVYAERPASSSQTNTATLTWPKQTLLSGTAAAQLLTSGTATGTASIDWTSVNPALVDGGVTVSDTLHGSFGVLSYTDASPHQYEYALSFTDAARTCTTHENVASFTTDTTRTAGSANQSVTVCVASDLIVTKTATPSFTRTFSWQIAKTATPVSQNVASGSSATFTYVVTVTKNAGTDSAWRVAGNITVKNPNDWEAITAKVTDAIDNGGVCPVTGGTNVSIPANDSATLAYTCTYASAPTPAAFTNTATAAWNKSLAFTPDDSAAGTAKGAFGDPTTLVDDSVRVSDPLGGALGSVSATTSFPYPFTFNPDPAGTCTPHSNTATFTTNTTSAIGTASQNVKVCVGADLAVSKTAIPTFTRTYLWAITKNADRTFVRQSTGTATFNYTVVASQTGFTDSAWLVSGTITVTNPNDWEDITLTTVSDAVGNGGLCTVTIANTTVPKSGSVPATYSCRYTAAPSPLSGMNTATATWNSATYVTPTGSASGPAAFAFGLPTTSVDQSIALSDTFNGTTTPLVPSTPLAATDATPFSSATFTYPRTVSTPCVAYPNIASFTTSDTHATGSASTTVAMCGQTGAKTMGFWQNKNGQAVIAAANCAALRTWLNQLHPFSDLSASDCLGVQTYIAGVIKAATCTSLLGTCNAMLRSQMLATALDVYFTDPALGGNRIGGVIPIGTISIDLTHVCQMIDGSGGTATCSGTYENVSSAFGGSTVLTVMQMLTYQNTADPSADAGVTWYANSKPTQLLAKDAFDAINT
ncbi:MAG: hypothetical protein AUH85_17355 [Chloroflexi bacterium 13_1_40CM_4_68_4]|nr:MAG: hypothetical protein AUH85_17355 [Chloroflexi bacterium 13_1_40CM_4_68_4]